MTRQLGPKPGGEHTPRECHRVHLSGEILLRRAGQRPYPVRIFDASPQGCKTELVERPALEERLWVKFEGLGAIEAIVCWAHGFEVGLKFAHPIHPAVFSVLMSKLHRTLP